MPFLPPNQQRQSTEGTSPHLPVKHTTTKPFYKNQQLANTAT